MDKNCKIGLVQMESHVGETEINIGKIISFSEMAAREGIKILCFPEMSMHGYAPEEAQHLAEPLRGENVRKISQLAVELGITILAGMAEKSDEPKPYLTHFIALADGKLDFYRKTHLGKSEEKYFLPGKGFPVFSSHGLCFGIGLCFDWHFPEVATIYSLKGAEVLFAPHASPRIIGDRRELWLRYLGARAYDNSVYLGACNVIGSNGRGQEFQGGSIVFNPKGEILTENFSDREGIINTELCSEYLNNLRSPKRKTMKEIFFLTERRKELYKEIIELDFIPGGQPEKNRT